MRTLLPLTPEPMFDLHTSTVHRRMFTTLSDYAHFYNRVWCALNRIIVNDLVPMAGESTSVGFEEPFTLISSSAEKAMGAATSGKGLMGQLKAGKEWIANKHSGVQPWTEFLNIRHVSRPKSVGVATSRLLSNLHRYQSNYLFVFLGLVFYCVLVYIIIN